MHTAIQRSGISAAKAAVGFAISGSGLLLFALPAFAGTGLGVTPNFPASVTVGSTSVAVSLDFTNNSTADVGSLTIDTIELTPQCGGSSVLCSTLKDPGVFSVSAAGTGANACAANTFTIAQTDATNGKVTFTPNAIINLALGTTCTINFTVNVLKVPTIDAGGSAGVQTDQSGQVTAHATNDIELPATGTGADVTTVNKVSPTIATTLSTTTPVRTGTFVHDSATLSGATSTPGGTATYTIFSNSSCNLGTTTAGTVAVTNGVVPDSNAVQFNTPGTFYWQVVYSGDANNNPATSTCGSEVLIVVAHPSTHLTKSPSATSVTPGTLVTYTYHEQNDGDVPLTSVSVTDDKCSPVVYSSGDTNANGILDPGEIWNFTCSQTLSTTTTNTATGHGSYNGQDVTWNPGICSPQYLIGRTLICNYNELASTTVTVQKNNPTIATTLSTTTATTTTLVHDSALLSGATATAGGTATYTVYTNNTCTIVLQGAGVKTVTNSVVPDSNAVQFSAPGTYYWQVVYSGDGANNAATSTCGSEVITITQPAGQWCSHGYWKQSQHFDSWVGYSPSQTFLSVFGENAFPGKTLLQVLQQGGGGLNALGRDTVGELLNTAAGLSTGWTTGGIIAAFDAAFPGTNSAYDALHARFVAPENCPLH